MATSTMNSNGVTDDDASVQQANHIAANACVARRAAIETLRMSSRSDTSTRIKHAGAQAKVSRGAMYAATMMAGNAPAQIESPPTRGTATACSDLGLGAARGKRAAPRSIRMMTPAAISSANPVRAAITPEPTFFGQ